MQLDELHDKAGELMDDLNTVLPERNVMVPSAQAELPATDAPASTETTNTGQESKSDSGSSSSGGRESTDEESITDLTEEPKQRLHGVTSKNRWGLLPKLHGMRHTKTTIKATGPLVYTSGEPVERRHVEVKRQYEHTNQRDHCSLQVLVAEKRKDDTRALAHAQDALRKHSQSSDSEDANDEGSEHDNDRFSPGTINMFCTDRMYPTWYAVQKWKECSRTLHVAAKVKHNKTASGRPSQAMLVISLVVLRDKNSEWCLNCPDMMGLPAALALHLRDAHRSLLPHITQHGVLERHDVDALLALVRPVGRCAKTALEKCDELQVFNSLRITHPKLHGKVRWMYICLYVTLHIIGECASINAYVN